MYIIHVKLCGYLHISYKNTGRVLRDAFNKILLYIPSRVYACVSSVRIHSAVYLYIPRARVSVYTLCVHVSKCTCVLECSWDCTRTSTPEYRRLCKPTFINLYLFSRIITFFALCRYPLHRSAAEYRFQAFYRFESLFDTVFL